METRGSLRSKTSRMVIYKLVTTNLHGISNYWNKCVAKVNDPVTKQLVFCMLTQAAAFKLSNSTDPEPLVNYVYTACDSFDICNLMADIFR